MSDPVNHPAHYTGFSYGSEVIDITEHLSFNAGNAVKYLARAGRKTSDPLEDLRKAAWYVNREITRLGDAHHRRRRQVNIPDEAVEALQKAEEETDPAWATYWTQRSQALSQIALVEAQEAANELSRIANLIALAGNNEAGRVADKAAGALTCCDGDKLRPEIARALGIEVAE